MRAIHQHEHEAINAREYPGTRQLCYECDDPTGRCEEDSIYADDDCEIGPLCEECWHDRPEYHQAEQEYIATNKFTINQYHGISNNTRK